MTSFLSSVGLLLVLLNPFLVIVYLADVVEKLDRRRFNRVLLRAGTISLVTFSVFAVLGDVIFSDVIQARFASFQIFGGIVFVLIGLQFVFRGPRAIEILRGDADHIAGAIAMPIMIGPGTISAAVIIGERHEPLVAGAAIVVAILASIVIMIVLKVLHDLLIPRRAELVGRYIDVAGRVTALFVGTISVEMIMQGLSAWLDAL